MPNQLLTTQLITDRALMRFSESLTMIHGVNRAYDAQWGNANKVGDTVRVPVPMHGIIRSGRVAQPTPMQTILRPVTILEQNGFDVTFNSSELALDIEEFDRRYLSQGIADLAIYIENRVQQEAIFSTPNQVGDPTTRLNNIFYPNLAKKYMEDNGAFKGRKDMLLNTSANVQIIDSLKGLFNSQEQIDVQYEEGYMGRAAGFDWVSSTVVPRAPRGTANGAYTAAAGQSGTAITVAAGAGTLLRGEIITFSTLFATHPQTKQNLGYLRQFVVTQDYAGGAGVINIYPAITLTGSEQNVVTAGGVNTIVVAGTASTPYGVSLGFTKDAFTFVTVDLPEYPDRECTNRNFEGLNMRVAYGSDITNDQLLMRFDVMWGFGALRPEFACRLANNDTLLTPAP